MPRIYRNHHASFPTFMVPYGRGCICGNDTYKCIVIRFSDGKWKLGLGDYYVSNFKYTDEDPFPCVGKINLSKILTEAILGRIRM